MQLLSANIEFTYEAELFEGDPTDAFEIAKLEAEAFETALLTAIESVVGESKSFRLRIKPE